MIFLIYFVLRMIKKIIHIILLSLIIFFFFLPWLDLSPFYLPKMSGATLGYHIDTIQKYQSYLTITNVYVLKILYILYASPILCLLSIYSILVENKYRLAFYSYVVTMFLCIMSLTLAAFCVYAHTLQYCTENVYVTLLLSVVGVLIYVIEMLKKDRNRVLDVYSMRVEKEIISKK